MLERDPAFFDASRVMLSTLRRINRPAEANELARAAGLDREHAYMGLVHLFDGKLARIRVGSRDRGLERNLWELI